ncbi:MAG TPA: acyl carrier protein [Candidatus Megaira endosymbiont of Hartmannula sinica]|nr:acyl carrier protein [Candidatus Megaera endosymbiont of Hartmannula sinica]
MTDNIQERIIKVTAETLSVDKESIKIEHKFVDDLGADSLDLVELIMAMEAEFDCEIPDSDSVSIQSVKDAIEYVKTKSSS